MDPIPRAPRRTPVPGRRWDAVTRTIDRPRLGTVTVPMAAAVGVLFVGAWLTLVAASGRDVVLVVAIGAAGAVVSGVLAAAANAFARPPRARRAFEAFVHLGEWELDRTSGFAGRSVKPTMAGLRRVLDDKPEGDDDRWLRTELLTVEGELDDAQTMAERMPVATPYQRLERTTALILIDWLSGGSGDPGPARDALAELSPAEREHEPGERARAEVVVALTEVRYRVGAGLDDPLGPLRDVRDRLGSAADDALIRMTRRAAPEFVRTAAGLIALVLVLDAIGLL